MEYLGILRGSTSYIFIPMSDTPDAAETSTLRCPRDSINGRRSPLSSRHRSPPSLRAYYPMPRGCASRRVMSMTPRRRSPCGCARRRPPSPVRCAIRRPSISTAGTNAAFTTCLGRAAPRRSALGAVSCALAAPRTQMVLPQSPLPTPHLHRTAAHCRCALGPVHPPVGSTPPRSRRRAGREGRGTPRPRVGPSGEPQHPAAHAPQAACPVVPHAQSTRCG